MTEAKARGFIHAMNSTQYGECNPEDTQALDRMWASERLAKDRVLQKVLMAIDALLMPDDDKQMALAAVRKIRGRLWYDDNGQWISYRG